MKRLVTIPQNNRNDFLKQIEKINTKAEKFGCEKVQIISESEVYEYEDESTDNDGNLIIRSCYVIDFEIEFPEIKLGDYTVIGIVRQPDRRVAEDVIQYYGEEYIHVKYENLDPYRCDHCGSRRWRREQIIVRNNKTNEELVIGKSCVENYTGCKLKGYNFFLNIIQDDKYFEYGLIYEISFKSENIINNVTDLIRQYGFIKGGFNSDTPTFEQFKQVYDENEEFDTAIVEDFRKYVNEVNFDSNFITNLRNIVKMDRISEKYIPMYVAGVNMFLKNKQYQEKKQIQIEKAKNSEYIGNEGDKETLEVTVERINTFESQYGIGVQVIMNNNGNKVIWFTNPMSFDKTHMVENKSYKIAATIKKHEEYRETKQTLVTRVKVM